MPHVLAYDTPVSDREWKRKSGNASFPAPTSFAPYSFYDPKEQCGEIFVDPIPLRTYQQFEIATFRRALESYRLLTGTKIEETVSTISTQVCTVYPE
jgi:hypothetical protein